MSKSFPDLGIESQQLIITQIQEIDLEKVSVSAKNLSVLGTALMKILRTANSSQEKTTEDEARDKWIVIRQLTHTLLEEILEKVKSLSRAGEIPEWERPSIMNLLHDIAKACAEEEIRTNIGEKDYAQLEASEDFINEMLEEPEL